MKVLLEYDEKTGNMSQNGIYIGAWVGLVEQKEPEDSKSSNIDSMVKLKNSGFTAKEVIEISKAGLL